ncbi:MAG: hypothetical protein EWV77_03730 [Microcystis viridis Mv_BB_P_19951000_S68D]|uniref:Uncharacterized protein n=1 Tax=Microcystis viridis Mv_BB_P_19951000_S68D TaxID=2486270 RepID=A0A552I5V3_MICVR|nr:MAG: hypothetical protein EWV77_03730 [Microcystis viridis Mv_BB_P_19951000_S68D]
MSIIFDLELTNQLNLLPNKDLVDLCPPIEPYQVTKSLKKPVFLSRLYDSWLAREQVYRKVISWSIPVNSIEILFIIY